MTIKLVYDQEADAATIHLVDPVGFGDVAESVICDIELNESAITLDFDARDRLIAIELLGASKLLPKNLLEND